MMETGGPVCDCRGLRPRIVLPGLESGRRSVIPSCCRRYDATSADSLVGQNTVVDVDEVLGFSAMLMPGEIYELSSTLTTTTSLLGPGSAARALFANSFLVELGSRPVPEPTTMVLLGMAAMIIGAKACAGFLSVR